MHPFTPTPGADLPPQPQGQPQSPGSTLSSALWLCALGLINTPALGQAHVFPKLSANSLPPRSLSWESFRGVPWLAKNFTDGHNQALTESDWNEMTGVTHTGTCPTS